MKQLNYNIVKIKNKTTGQWEDLPTLVGPRGNPGPQGERGAPTSVNGKTGENITLVAGDVDAYTKAEVDAKLENIGNAYLVTVASWDVALLIPDPPSANNYTDSDGITYAHVALVSIPGMTAQKRLYAQQASPMTAEAVEAYSKWICLETDTDIVRFYANTKPTTSFTVYLYELPSA